MPSKPGQPGTGWMPPLPLGWGLSSSQVWYHGLTRLVEAVDREALEGLAFPGPFVSVSASQAVSLPAGPGEELLISQGLLLWASLIFTHSLVALLSPVLGTVIVLRTICGVLWRFLQAQGELCSAGKPSSFSSAPGFPQGSLHQRSLRIKALSHQISQCPFIVFPGLPSTHSFVL